MKTPPHQRGESQTLALCLLVIVVAIICYLFFTGEIGTSVKSVGQVLGISE